MSIARTGNLPLKLTPSHKREVRTQFGALCWRMRKGSLQVLLITSRKSRRWIVPKGWPMDGHTPFSTAAQEAYEEAGVVGRADDICLGIFTYIKERSETVDLPCVVALFPVKVADLRGSWPEKADRKRRWFRPKRAAALVEEPELKRMLKTFDPFALGL